MELKTMVKIKENKVKNLLTFLLNVEVEKINNTYISKLNFLRLENIKYIFNLAGVEYIYLYEINDKLKNSKTFKIQLNNNKYYYLKFWINENKLFHKVEKIS